MLYLGSTPMVMGTSIDLVITRDVIEKSSKSSAAAKEYRTGRYGWEINADGLVAADLSNTDDLETKITSGTVVTVKVAKVTWSGQTPTIVSSKSGSAIVKSFRMTSGTEEHARFSVSIQGTGEYTTTT